MKITITPTRPVDYTYSASSINHGVTLEHPSDDLTADELILLFGRAMVAYGFHPDSVAEVLSSDLVNDFR